MSLNLPSLSAPVSGAQPPASAAARNGDPEKNSSGSFGEVLARAAKPAGETATKSAEKNSANSSPARGQDGDEETDAEESAELVNLLGAGFIPPEGRLPPLALPGGAVAASRGDPRPPIAADPLAQPLAGVPLPAVGSVALADAGTDVEASATPVLALAAANPKERGQSTSLATRPDAAPVDILTAAAPTGTKIAAPEAAQDTAFFGRPSSQAADSPLTGTGEATGSESETGVTRSAPNAASQASDAPLPSAETLTPATVAGTSAPASGLETGAITAPPTMGPALQGSANLAGSSPPQGVITPSLPQEVGSSEWGKALGQQLVRMDQGGHEVAELQLNPPGLGPLKVTLSMNDHQVQAMFVSAHSSVRAAVEAALPQLRATLADSGISLGDTSVGAESRPQADVNQGQGGQQSGQRSYARADISTSPTIAERPAIEPRRSGHGITVDTYA